MIDPHHGWNKSYKPLFLGYVFSIILTLAAYRIVFYHLTPWLLLFTVFGLGIAQTILQLIFFLHMGLESKPHWNTISFFFMLAVIVLIVGGSIWIMSNMNYHNNLPAYNYTSQSE